MSQPAFDPTMFGGQPGTPPIPMVVCWDDLDPSTYTRQLTELADWIGWLRATYRIPATVIPPCWFTHPGIREDIGHLWTGWLLTRHPDTGVGMIGLDWDQRRDAAISRLREATAITGCSATRHQAEPEPTDRLPSIVNDLWQDHINAESEDRARAMAGKAVVEIVTEILQAAELRHELAPTILAKLADDTATGDGQEPIIAERLRDHAVRAVDRAVSSATAAAATVLDAQHHAALEAKLAEARDNIATSAASSVMKSDTTPSVTSTRSNDWLDALDRLLPADLAAQRARASATARETAIDRRAARRRHPDIDDLLE